MFVPTLHEGGRVECECERHESFVSFKKHRKIIDFESSEQFWRGTEGRRSRLRSNRVNILLAFDSAPESEILWDGPLHGRSCLSSLAFNGSFLEDRKHPTFGLLRDRTQRKEHPHVFSFNKNNNNNDYGFGSFSKVLRGLFSFHSQRLRKWAHANLVTKMQSITV